MLAKLNVSQNQNNNNKKMADTSKAQKLKSSKKRYKELLQEQKKKKNVNHNSENGENVREQTPADSLTSSTHSSITTEQPAIPDSYTNTQLPNYFSNTNYESNFQPPAVFFDSLLQSKETNEKSNAFSTYFNSPNPMEHTVAFNNQIDVNKDRQTNNINSFVPDVPSYSLLQENLSEQQATTVEAELEIAQNDQDFHNSHFISEEDTRHLMDYLQGNGNEAAITSVRSEETAQHQSDVDSLGRFSDQRTTENASSEKTEQHQSCVESLKQFSDQMAQLIEPNLEFSSNSITDLEKRNLELASQLEHERMKCQQLAASIEEHQMTIAKLEAEQKEKELSTDLQMAQEVSRLKEELQCHMCTVGMLVAEKTELSANLSQFELISKQRSAECEELQARLKTSRSRVADLERETNILKADKTKNDHFVREQLEQFEKLKVEYKSLKDEKEELTQDLLEAREKLRQTSETNVNLQQHSQELSGKLSLANVKIQQLTTGDHIQIDGQIEQIMQEKFALEKQVSSLNQTLKSITKERDEFNLQYQQYAQQLNAQLSIFSTKIEQLQTENENLIVQEQNRIKHIGELERQLQNLQNEHVNYATQRNNGSDSLKSDMEASRELCIQLQVEKTALEENYMKVSNEKDMLLKELEAKSDSMSQMESLIEQLRGNQPDSVKLLATMESDKVAAARAVAQNKELKQQMEGMQEVFMKLTNDKVELTDKLTMEQRTNKDLIEKLQKTEIHLQTLADAIEIKDRELSHLRDNFEELNKQVLQQGQLTDRLRHYEAQDHCSHALQTDLQEAKQTIIKLTNEINQQKQNYIKTTTSNGHNDVDDGNGVVDELQQKLDALNLKNKELEAIQKNRELVENAIEQSNNLNTDNNHNDEMNMLDKEVTRRHLEDKVKRTMQEIADLTEEKQRLEHLVLQLQSETETIGEYVALYQHQRSILKLRALEKDQQLKQLANDREQMKMKLQKLNDLIKKLVVEKGSVTSELLQQHDSLNSDSGNLCDEHSKIHQEINKITEDKLVSSDEHSESTETAEQIIVLLSEIKTSNLMQPNESVHHCPWCSGQLITV